MEILLRLDALTQSEVDVLRRLPNIVEIHLYSLNPKSWEGEVKVFSFIFFPSPLQYVEWAPTIYKAEHC